MTRRQHEAEALIALLPSPLLGPAVWRPVEDLLRRAGRRATTVTDPTGPTGVVAQPDDVLEALVAQLPADEDLVVVLHSNAGLYAGALAERRSVRALVFVDAGIPALGAPTPTAPEQAMGMLERLADDEGLLPPWTRWWPEEDVADLFPDDATRALVEGEQSRTRLSYFRAALPPADGWERLPCACLAFGDTYADEVARARRLGWPVVVLDGRHLHMLVDPEQVADEIARLVDLLTRAGTPPGSSPVSPAPGPAPT